VLGQRQIQLLCWFVGAEQEQLLTCCAIANELCCLLEGRIQGSLPVIGRRGLEVFSRRGSVHDEGPEGEHGPEADREACYRFPMGACRC
jgi:hypothetical protein